MKKILLTTAITIMCTSVCIAATYKIKSNGTVTSGSTNTQQTTNLYNNYSSGQYVNNNTVNAQPASIIDIVMDFSGSMSSTVQVAKSTMSSVVAQIPSSTQIGFRVFGQGDFVQAPKMADIKTVEKTTNESGKTVYKMKTKYKSSGMFNSGAGCQATALVTPIAAANANALISGMNSVELGGSTPMVLALQQAAYSDLGSISRNTKKKIVLITDGGENCGGDPCSFAKTLMATRRDISIDVVLVSSSSRHLQCLAATTGGRVYNLSNVNELGRVLTQSINTPAGQNQNQPQNYNQEQQQNYEFINE